MSTDSYTIRESLRRAGGRWLGLARVWMQSNVRKGDTMTWGDTTLVQIPFCELEHLALEAAVGATLDANAVKEGPGTVPHRFKFLIDELEKRFPHPAPFDSTKPPEQYALEAIDALLATQDANLPRGWVVWDGIGNHPTGDTKVYYRMRDGDACDFDDARACNLDWAHTPAKQDWEIVAYKVVDDQQ